MSAPVPERLGSFGGIPSFQSTKLLLLPPRRCTSIWRESKRGGETCCERVRMPRQQQSLRALPRRPRPPLPCCRASAWSPTCRSARWALHPRHMSKGGGSLLRVRLLCSLSLLAQADVPALAGGAHKVKGCLSGLQPELSIQPRGGLKYTIYSFHC